MAAPVGVNHPMSAKYVELVRKLLDLSRRGDLLWRATFDPNRYIVDFPWSSVAIEHDGPRDHLESYAMTLYDSTGRPIDTISGAALARDVVDGECLATLQELYRFAREGSKQADRVLDATLGALDRMARA